jgi:hypothetical protein
MTRAINFPVEDASSRESQVRATMLKGVPRLEFLSGICGPS